MRNKFEEQLMHLNNELITMGALCEEAISGCVKYLFNSDSEMKEAVIEVEKQIDQKERDIEQLCMKLLIQQQPVATDLRRVTSILRIVSDLERIADHCQDISEYILLLAAEERVPSPAHVEEMVEKVREMIRRTAEAFVNDNEDEARARKE